jgi:hypothetical protein
MLPLNCIRVQPRRSHGVAWVACACSSNPLTGFSQLTEGVMLLVVSVVPGSSVIRN